MLDRANLSPIVPPPVSLTAEEQQKINKDFVHAAEGLGTLSDLETLLNKGAEVDAHGDFGSTALHAACLRGNTGMVELLVSHGATVNAPDESQATPLHFLIEGTDFDKKTTDLARYLLDNGADWQAKNDEGRIPIDLAHEQGDADLIALLDGEEGIRHGSIPMLQRGARS